MTYRIVRIAERVLRAHRAQALLAMVLGAATSGCGSDGGGGVSLTLVAPADEQVLTVREHDTDPDRSGLQFDVEGRARRIARGTTVNLFIDGEPHGASGRVDADGNVTLADVTLPPGNHRIHLETSNGATKSNATHEYTLRALVIESPNQGATLTGDDDEDPTEDGVQISVTVSAFALDLTEDITLLVDGDAVETATADEEGEVVFSGITLNSGQHTFKATSGEGDDTVESGEVTVEVRQSCAGVTFLEPAPPPSGEDRISIGGDSCPAAMSGDPFETRVRVSTDAGDGRPITLIINGQAVASTRVDETTAVFEDVVLNRFSSANEIRVEVENSEGVRCIEDFPADVFVDCAGADCEITGPTPVAYVDDSGVSHYLNAAMRDDDGFDIEVTSDEELVGRDVQLIIDGDTRRALRATATRDDDASTAVFDDVELDEGTHRVEALCTDAAGNVTSSGELTWIVDVTACGVAVTDPAEDTLIVPANDEDNASSGTQVVVSSTVTGDDCVRQRSAVCDGSDGITGREFVDYDGNSPLLTAVTLDESGELSLCVEVEDRAGNIGLGAVDVSYRDMAPLLAIERPSTGDRYNAEGGSGYTADADPINSPAACDAEFWVQCTEIGGDVQLRRDSATGDVLATAECEEPQAGDGPVPAAYAGRAKVTALFGSGQQTIVATQSVPGSGSGELVGVSLPIEIEGDCARPALSWSGISCTAPGNQIEVGDADGKAFSIFNSGMDNEQATLTITRMGGSSITPAASVGANTVEWSDVDFGFDGAGTLELQAEVTDGFGNRSALSCTIVVATDVPEILAVSSPADGEAFGPSDGCDPGVPGQHGVPLAATIDQVADREVDVFVNAGDLSTATPVLAGVAIGAGGGGTGVIDACVPVPDNATNMGASAIALRVSSTVDVTADIEVRTVHVVLDGPADGVVLDEVAEPAEDDEEHRDGVVASWSRPQEGWDGQFVGYQLRCAGTEVDSDPEAWWAAADEVDVPDDLIEQVSPSIVLPHRPAEPRHCVVRVADVLGNLSPIVESTDLTLALRQTVIAAGTASSGLGYRVAAAGDIDGDGLDDVLAGGIGRTELIFGTSGDPASAARVVFTSTGGIAETSVAGIGDFNGDGLDDFAIGNMIANANAGWVSVFFGRPRAQWPASIDIETTCNADLCIEGAPGNLLGRIVAAAGDFDDDDRVDFAIGSSAANQVVVVLGDDYEVRDCSACRASETCDGGMCVRNVAPGAGVPSFWRLRFSLPTGDAIDPASGPELRGFELVSTGTFGVSIAGLGNFDGLPGDDLAIGASGARQVHFLSGQGYSGSGIQPLSTTDLGIPDPGSGTPDGQPIAAVDVSTYGFMIANIGDFYEASGVAESTLDLGVARVNQNTMYVVPGDRASEDDGGFGAPLVSIQSGSNIGHTIATAMSPVHDLLGDLDGDGVPELCVGTRTQLVTPHDILLWYPDQFASAISAMTVPSASGISIPVETSGTNELVVQYVGDFNGDGHKDIAVGDFRSNSTEGRVVLLY